MRQSRAFLRDCAWSLSAREGRNENKANEENEPKKWKKSHSESNKILKSQYWMPENKQREGAGQQRKTAYVRGVFIISVSKKRNKKGCKIADFWFQFLLLIHTRTLAPANCTRVGGCSLQITKLWKTTHTDTRTQRSLWGSAKIKAINKHIYTGNKLWMRLWAGEGVVGGPLQSSPTFYFSNRSLLCFFFYLLLRSANVTCFYALSCSHSRALSLSLPHWRSWFLSCAVNTGTRWSTCPFRTLTTTACVSARNCMRMVRKLPIYVRISACW